MEQGIDEPVNESSLSDLSVLIYSILLSKLCISNTVISDIYRQKKDGKKQGLITVELKCLKVLK